MTALWRHQEEALAYALDHPACLLNMGMGTGKTLVALELARRIGSKRILVVCPLSVGMAWTKQIREHTGDHFRWILLTGVCESSDWRPKRAKNMTVRARSNAMREFLAAAPTTPSVVIVNYEAVRAQEFFDGALPLGFDLIVMDEIHRLKDPFGVTQKRVRGLCHYIKRRLGLTGTVLPHCPGDAFSQYRCLDPSILGWSFVKFMARYAVRGGYKNHEVVGWTRQDELQEKLGRIMFRCERDVLELPPVRHEVLSVTLSPAARKAYQELETNFRADVQDGRVTASNALTRLLRLQQMTSGRAVLDGDADQERRVEVLDRGKQTVIGEIIEATSAKEKIVFFVRFLADLDAIEEECEKADVLYSELSGRRKDLEAWQLDPRRRVIGVQIQAGGLGIDLSMAPICVYVSLGFSLGDYEQSLARVHRPGQKKPVIYYHIVAKDTVDEKVYHALRARKNVIEEILSGIAIRKVG